MTLLIACLLIAGFGMSPAWYGIAAIAWIGHLCWSFAIVGASGRSSAQAILDKIPGIRGPVPP